MISYGACRVSEIRSLGLQEADERQEDLHDCASDVERTLRARTAATSTALAALLQRIDAARAAPRAEVPPDALQRVEELQKGARLLQAKCQE